MSDLKKLWCIGIGCVGGSVWMMYTLADAILLVGIASAATAVILGIGKGLKENF